MVTLISVSILVLGIGLSEGQFHFWCAWFQVGQAGAVSGTRDSGPYLARSVSGGLRNTCEAIQDILGQQASVWFSGCQGTLDHCWCFQWAKGYGIAVSTTL